MSLKNRHKIIASLMVLVLLVTLMVTLTFRSYGQIKKAAEERRHTFIILAHSNELLSALKDAETGQRGYVLSGEEAFLQPYLGVRDSVTDHLEHLRQHTLDTTAKKSLDRLRPLINVLLQDMSQVIELRRSGDKAGAVQAVTSVRGKRLMDSIRNEISGISRIEEDRLKKVEEEFQANMRSMLTMMIFSSMVTLILVCAFAYLIYRESEQRLKNLVHLETAHLLEIQERTNTQLQQTNQTLQINEETTRRLVSELEVYQIEQDSQNTELRRSQEELETQQIELELQNEELRRAREELEESRNKYSELYDFAPVGYFTFDPGGLIREVNLTGAQMLGIERQLLAETPFTRFITDENGLEVFAEHLAMTLQGHGIQRCEVKLAGKEGVTIHALLQSVIVETDERTGRDILSSIVDGTAAKKLETEIQDAREYSESIVETVHKPLVVMNSDLKILTANHCFYATFEVTPEETIGNFIYDLGNRQWDIPGLRVLFEDILPNDSVFNSYEVDHCFPGIGRKVITLNARQIFRKNIGSHIILLAMEDNTARTLAETERTRLEQVLQDKNIELERATLVAEKANLAKSDFLSSMSHELRTPLSAILGFAQLVESGSPQPTPVQKRSIDQILKAGWYLLELINEILDLALIESGKLSISLEPVSLAEIMDECETMIETQAKKYGIGMTFIRFETPCFIQVDRTRVKQVLINLLSNAIKYNSAGGTVVVESVLKDADTIRISVRDTGEGLTPELLEQLFQPFNRLGQEAGDEQGTGIGLVVSKRLVECMGGVIGVESTVGTGSVFWVELNLITEPQADALLPESAEAALAVAHNDKPLQTLLYVEDNPANMMLVEDIIARRPDIRLLGARNGKSGIEIARSSLPDVILMDINLPGISGIDAMKILAVGHATAHIPVIALSANAMPRDIERGLEAGFFHYLTKPINVDEFMQTLDMAMKFAQEKATHAAKT
jgi:PAS domain S-box-containing protein